MDCLYKDKCIGGDDMDYNFTYRERNNGWQVILSYKVGNKWKQRSKQGFAKKSLAKQYGDQMLEEIKDMPIPIVKSMSDITLENFLQVFLDDNPDDIIAGTKKGYVAAVNALGSVKNIPIPLLNYLNLSKAFKDMNVKGSTQQNYLARIKRLLNYARFPYKIISENPANDIKPAKSSATKKKIALTDEQLSKLLKNTKEKDFYIYAIYCVAAYAGLRHGEIFGLKWSDISDNNLHVVRQLNVTRSEKRELIECPIKNKETRVIPIPTILLNVFSSLKKDYPTHITNRIFPKYKIDKNLTPPLREVHPYATLHSLRHTYATKLLSQGVDIQTVAALIGDNVKTVMEYYIHYNDDMRKAAEQDIKRIFA